MKTAILTIFCTVSITWLRQPFADAAVRYVNVNSASPSPPYTNWSTAARVIQDAVDLAEAGDEIIVTNGVYQSGGRAVHGTVTNRVAVTKPLTLRSVSGAAVTIINGNGVMRCAYLTNGTTLTGFTLTNGVVVGAVAGDPSALPFHGHEFLSGGGVWCESFDVAVSDCVLSGNSATYGGGAFSGTLNHCQLTGNIAYGGGGAVRSGLYDCQLMRNSASFFGGGAYLAAALYNCILVGNAAQYGGGAYFGYINNCTIVNNAASSQGGGVWCHDSEGWCNTIGCYPRPECNPCVSVGNVFNSIIYDNIAPEGANHFGYAGEFAIKYSCTTPWPTDGIGNITNAPLFVDAVTGDLRLQSNSPCINAGRNTYLPWGAWLDLDGSSRIEGGAVDLGAYEFQSPQSTISYGWLQQYRLATDGSADFADPDGDGHNNWQEWRAWTDPTNSMSALRFLAPVVSTNGLILSWPSVSGQLYLLERSTNLTDRPAFFPLANYLVGRENGVGVYTDTNSIGHGALFYRIGVQE